MGVPTGVSDNAPSNAAMTTYGASIVAKTTAGLLFGFSGYNSKTSTQFIQVHDAAALPTDTAIPKIVLVAGATSNFSWPSHNAPYPRHFANGIVVVNSSTGPTLTIGSADIWVDVQYS